MTGSYVPLKLITFLSLTVRGTKGEFLGKTRTRGCRSDQLGWDDNKLYDHRDTIKRYFYACVRNLCQSVKTGLLT